MVKQAEPIAWNIYVDARTSLPPREWNNQLLMFNNKPATYEMEYESM